MRNRALLRRCTIQCAVLLLTLQSMSWADQPSVREHLSFNADWRFKKGDPNQGSNGLTYYTDLKGQDRNEFESADGMSLKTDGVEATQTVLKPWILPTGNDFIKDPTSAPSLFN